MYTFETYKMQEDFIKRKKNNEKEKKKRHESQVEQVINLQWERMAVGEELKKKQFVNEANTE